MTKQTGSAPAPFALTKWYFDCVAEDGRVVIAYWLSLTWRRLAFTWESVVLYAPRTPPERRSGFATSSPPVVADGAVVWRAPGLGCSLSCAPTQAAIEQRLLEDHRGVVDWRAEAPAAMVTVTLHGHAPLTGSGYAERMSLTVPPWRLPIRELRWGRWLDADAAHSVVWIDWRGPAPHTWVFEGGRLATSATVTDDGVFAGDTSVVVGVSRTLESLSLADMTAAMPPLQATLPKSLLALRETKWCSEATRKTGDGCMHGGRAIHEVVVFA